MRSLFLSLFVLVMSSAATAVADDANSLLESVHRARANWEGLPGFVAQIKVFAEGQWQQGQLTVRAPDQVEISGIELENERLVQGAIGSLVRHRYSESEVEPVTGMQFAEETEGHPFGRLIEPQEADGSQFRVHEGVLREVLRETPRGRFAITVLDVYRSPEDKYLPQTYTVTFWNEQGQITSASTIQNEWVRVSKWDLPRVHAAIRASEGSREVVRVEFSDHRIIAE